jgi:hypothetical protein
VTTRAALVLALSCPLLACTGQAPTPAAEAAPRAGVVTPPADPGPAAREAKDPAPDVAAVVADAPEPPIDAPPPAEEVAPVEPDSADEPTSLEPAELASAAPEELAITPWSAAPRAVAWTLAAEPSEPLALVDLHAGVLGRGGGRWWQLGADGTLAAVEMSVEPELPILGVWPTDAWFVNRRYRNDGGGSDDVYLELRLMKLRGGDRWVPQVYSGSGEQWFHPGTEDEDEPHMSALSGMLVYPRSLERITRVAGRHGDPVLGARRGEAVDFLEVGSGKVLVLSRDADGTYVQTACDDEACVAAKARKLPLSGWTFGRRALRGKHGASVLATAEGRSFVLHHDGKSGVWRLDELPPGEAVSGMWASAGGGLWTLSGELLRRRDGDGTWHEVALPEGMTGPSVAVDVDRAQLWVSGVVGGAAKLFTTPADPRP